MKRILQLGYVLALGFSTLLVSCSASKINSLVSKTSKVLGGCGAVDQTLEQASLAINNFQGATKAVNASRDLLFDIAAASEKKEQLKAKEAELEQTQSEQDKERITIEIAEEKDKTIQEAHRNGEFQKLKLTGEQINHVGRIIWNTRLAIKLDQKVIKTAPAIITSGKAAIDQSLKNPACAPNVAKLTTVIVNHIPHIAAEAPRQVGTLTEFLTATMELANSNGVSDPGEPSDNVKIEDLQF